MKKILISFCILTSMPVFADGKVWPEETQLLFVDDALKVIEKQVSEFASEAQLLATVAHETCTNSHNADALKDQFAKTYMAWQAIEAYQFGPIQQQGLTLAMNFWPDKKGFVERHFDQFQSIDPAKQNNPEMIAATSAAIQGFPALDRLLYVEGMEVCPLAEGISALISSRAHDIEDGWLGADGWANLMRSAGSDNPVYHTPLEAIKAIYTSTDFAIFRAYSKLNIPFGDNAAGYPNRVEARYSGLSGDLIIAQLESARLMIERGYVRAVSQPDRVWAENQIIDAQKAVEEISTSLSDAVGTKQGRFEIDRAKTKIAYAQEQVAENVGPYLGVDTGFTAADGD